MPIKPTIRVEEIVKDIRAGMPDFDLVEKCGLTLSEFDSILAHLVDSGLMTRQELHDRQQLSESQKIRLFVDSRVDSKELA